jgi:hypothetical protein
MSVPTKLPTADTNFKQKQGNLAKFATNVYNSMGSSAGLGYFPTPPVTLANLVSAINEYTGSLADARKGSKDSTQLKNTAKALLIAELRANAQYVTTVAQSLVVVPGGPVSTNVIALMRHIILVSGYKLSKAAIPVANTVGVRVPIIRKLISKAPGTIHILLRQYTKFKKGTKTWQVQYRASVTPPTPVNPWITSLQTSGNMTITEVVSGKTDVQVAAIGGHNTRTNSQNPLNYSPIRTIIVT